MLTWDEVGAANSDRFSNYVIIRGTGAVVPFEPNKAVVAVMKAFIATTSATKEHLFTLSKRFAAAVRLRPGKASGFFSASKANLRNAP